MRDWSDLWLNEGFATYMVYQLLEHEHPKLTENEYLTRLCQLVRRQVGATQNDLCPYFLGNVIGFKKLLHFLGGRIFRIRARAGGDHSH